jgi:hypothetical protein
MGRPSACCCAILALSTGIITIAWRPFTLTRRLHRRAWRHMIEARRLIHQARRQTSLVACSTSMVRRLTTQEKRLSL